MKNIDEFVDKLKKVEISLKNGNRYRTYKEEGKCQICGEIVRTKEYKFKNFFWSDDLVHSIEKHKYVTNDEFNELINNANIKKVKLMRGINVEDRVLLNSKQINIMDALMINGGNKIYQHKDKDNKMNMLYSEHSGMLSVSNNKIDGIIISGNINRIDENDPEIYLPENIRDINNNIHKYYFHTHPPTPKPGSRISNGVVYEFPSSNDVYHFIVNHLKHNINGSIVMTPEGLYNIRVNNKDENVNILDQSFLIECNGVISDIQHKAINKYGNLIKRSKNKVTAFMKYITKDRTFINAYNQYLHGYNVHIDYKNRQKINGKWLFNDIYLEK